MELPLMAKPADIPQDVWETAGKTGHPNGMKEAIARAIIAAKAEERQVFIDMIDQFGSAKLIARCRAAIRERGEASNEPNC